MEHTFEFDEALGALRMRLSGEFDSEKVPALFDALLAEPSLQAGADILSDQRDLAGQGNADFARSLVPRLTEFAERLGQVRVAVVAPADALFGMTRVVEVLAEPSGVTVRPFRSMEEAEAWLAQDVGSRTDGSHPPSRRGAPTEPAESG